MFDIEVEHTDAGYAWGAVLKLGQWKYVLLSNPQGTRYATKKEAFDEGALALAFALGESFNAVKLSGVGS